MLARLSGSLPSLHRLLMLAALLIAVLAACSRSEQGRDEETASPSALLAPPGATPSPGDSVPPGRTPPPGTPRAAPDQQAGQGQRESFLYYINEGNYRSAAGEGAAAIAAYRHALRIFPQSAEGHFLLGRALSAPSIEQDFPEAMKEFLKARELGLDRPGVAYGLAFTLVEQDRYDEASPEIARVLSDPSSSSDLRAQSTLLAVKIHIRRNELDGAVSRLAELETLVPSLPEPLRKALEPVISLQTGLLAKGRQDWEGAAAAFERALQADPEEKEARYQLAAMLDRLGRRDEAALQREIHSLFESARGSVATKDRSNTAKLGPVYARLKELLPGYYRAYARMVHAYFLAEEFEEGITECRAGLGAIADSAETARFRAELHFLMANCHAAVAQRSPDVEERVRRLNDAAKGYREAGRLEPQFEPRAREYLSQVDQTLKNLGYPPSSGE
ncbi:MAG: tetratricopeptide repeat protein [Planctomycetota bacterium]